ncbi:tsukushi-A-like [Arctopsyche grandis]|uniref:tsukushi-A-like n=1 Tax=Arctopsyche grandis TaxID=121162 RepID=UPI00406DA1C2
MKWWIILILVQFLRAKALVTTPGPPKYQRCVYERAFKMNGAYCKELNLHSVPSTLKSNIEILDLSFNRIRDLKNETFSRYTNVKYLYLGDNMIQTIEPLAFEPLTALETLDLSLNGLHTIPEAVFNLPMLRKLYISDNSLKNLYQELKLMEKPFRAPITYLDMMNTQLFQFPDLGMMPYLQHLNVSQNKFTSLEPKNLANMCSLRVLDLTDSFSIGDNACANKPLISWFLDKEIQAVPELYSIINPNGEDMKHCNSTWFDKEVLDDYDECKKHIHIQEKEKTAKKTWIIVAGSLGGFLLLAVIFLCCMHQRNVNKTNTEAQQRFLSKHILND